MPPLIREFGSAIPGVDYILRPGAYGVLRDENGRVGFVTTPQGAFLLGGGQEPNESPQQALVRETREECGATILIGDCLGLADELVFAREEAAHFRKRGTFFLIRLVEATTARTAEVDHTLTWLPANEAIGRLTHESHRWAVHASLGAEKNPGR